MTIEFDARKMTADLRGFDRSVQRAAGAAFLRRRPIAEGYMKQHAPWTDRTGNARSGLTAKVSNEPDSIVLTLSHSVPYGVYLETRWSGKYAIIVPTIQNQAPLVMKDVSNLLNRMK